MFLEGMIVLHLLKSAFEHHVLKMIRPIELGHPDAQPLLRPKVPRFPSHFFSRTEQPSRHTCNSPLACVLRRVRMSVNAARQIEHPFPRRGILRDVCPAKFARYRSLCIAMIGLRIFQTGVPKADLWDTPGEVCETAR